MIIFANAEGTITKLTPDHVYQGSNRANAIYFVAPFASTNHVTVNFKLPNKEFTVPVHMTFDETISGVYGTDDMPMSGWKYLIPSAVTQYEGTVTLQFRIYTNTGEQTLSTMSSTFTVERGTPSDVPISNPLDDEYAYLAGIDSRLSDAEESISEKVDKNLEIAGIDLTDDITKEELQSALNVEDGAEVNVQPDWNEANASSDAFIRNKPTIGYAAGNVPFLDENAKLPLSVISDAVLGQMVYGGTVTQTRGDTVASLSTNAKSKLGIESDTLRLINLSAEVGGYRNNQGIYYIVSGSSSFQFAYSLFSAGDWLIATADGWKKIDNTEPVNGVRGAAQPAFQTGYITITPTNIGLGNVDNTADADKPVSSAQQAALLEKQDVLTTPGLTFTYDENNYVATVIGIQAEPASITKKIVIPRTTVKDGVAYTVTQIGDSAFISNTVVTEIVIPDTVTNIAYRAFRNCTALKRLVIPDSVTTLGDEVAFTCTSLKEVIIGDGVTTIPTSAFHGCTALNNVTLGKNINEIKSDAFGATNHIVTFNILNPSATPITNTNGFYYSDYDIPPQIIYIPQVANNTALLNDYRSNAGWSAYADKIFYKPEILPLSVQTPLSDIFNVSVGAGGELEDVNGIHYSIDTSTNTARVIWSPYNMTDIIIPKYIRNQNGRVYIVTQINASVFTPSQADLKSIKIPDTVVSIAEPSFTNFTALETVIIGKGLKFITYNMFYGCTNLKRVIIGGDLDPVDNDRTYWSMQGITDIRGQSFLGCTSLEDVTIPDTVVESGGSTFRGCTGLKSAVIGNGMYELNHHYFYGCSSLTKVVLGTGIRVIGRASNSEVFTGCSALKTLVLNSPVVVSLPSPGDIPNTIEEIIVPGNLVSSYKVAPGWSNFADKIMTMKISTSNIGNSLIQRNSDGSAIVSRMYSQTPTGNEASELTRKDYVDDLLASISSRVQNIGTLDEAEIDAVLGW